MSEAQELTLADLHSMNSKTLVTTSNDEDVVKAGTYITKATKSFAVKNAEDADFNPGRVMISFSVSFYAEDGTTRVGTAFLRTSPEERYTAAGRLDKLSKTYVNLAKAVGVDGSNPGELVAAALQTAFLAKVRECYMVEDETDLAPAHADVRPMPGGAYYVSVAADDAASREHYASLGLEAKVQFDRVSKLA